MVVISCGVNDLSCYGLWGQELADKVCPLLDKVCRKHQSTTFIFNSVLYTRHSWLNNEIDILNSRMFDLSLHVHNFLFFDSSSIISDHPLGRKLDNIVDPRDRRGVHITRAARVLISDNLVNGLELIWRRNAGKSLPPALDTWTWPLRNVYRGVISTF